MRTILRNFFSVLCRFKMATVLNILGLSITYTVFMLIMLQMYYDYRFDSCQPNVSTIYRLDTKKEGRVSAAGSRPLFRLFAESSSHIVGDVLMDSQDRKLFFRIEKNNENLQFEEKSRRASNGLTKVFQFDMKEGTTQAFEEPGTVLLPESLAKRIFGDESALDKQLQQYDNTLLRVAGVYKDFPGNSSLSNVIYLQLPPQENYNSWDRNYVCFFRLDSPDAVKDLVPNFQKNTDLSAVFGSDFSGDDPSGSGLQLSSLRELHFLTDITADSLPKANRLTLKVLFAIAFIIILMAGINFTNFSIALTPRRIKGINTQKVLGCSNATLRKVLLSEAICISIFAYLLSLILLVLVKQTSLASLIDGGISFSQYSIILWEAAIVAIAIGVLASIYPAFHMTSFQPALVLKGSFGNSPKGRKLRNILVGIQFAASFALIIAAVFMYLQNNYMQTASLGYDKEAVIVSDMSSNIYQNQDAVRNTLLRFPEIEDVAFASEILSSGDDYGPWGCKFRGKAITFIGIPVSLNFLQVMGIEVKKGRDFREDDKLKESAEYIFNETAAAQYNLDLNDNIRDGEVIGIIPDIKITSFREETTPMAFCLIKPGKMAYAKYVYIKAKAKNNLHTTMSHVRESFDKFDKGYPFNIHFYDSILQQTYEKELKIGFLITLFSLIAIFISIVGVFGLVVFESEYRRKEIAVRKVLGATTSEILLMFNRNYLLILIICFCIGAPVAWYGVYQWLENFAYHIPMFWWILPLAFVAVALLTILTVTYQNWQVANENPAENVKSE